MSKNNQSGHTARGGGVQHFWLGADAPWPPRIARADGVYLWDTDGNRYLDATSGPVAVNLGHGNPRVLAAMRAQAEQVCFAYPSYFDSAANTALTDKLVELAGPGFDRAFYVSGGSEAVEKCIEFARLYAVANRQPDRTTLISRYPAYHGSTLSTQALSENPNTHPLGPLLQRWPKVPVPWSYCPTEGMTPEEDALYRAEALRETIENAGPDTVLAFILEPIMGFSGGANYSPESYYNRIREICTEYGVLLIYDEVMSGAGRTGKFLAAHRWPDARPDLVIIGKGLGSGYYPIATFLAPERMVEAVVASGGFNLGHTHKASPLACAVGLAVLQELTERNLMENAETMGIYLREQLNALKQSIPIIGDVRGLGLMNAIELVADKSTRGMLPRSVDHPKQLSGLAMEHGLLLYARRTFAGKFGDWLMCAPPLISDAAAIDELTHGLGAVLSAYPPKP